jgi:hypothetical protein
MCWIAALPDRPSIIFDTVGGQGFGPSEIRNWLTFTHRMKRIRLHVKKATARFLTNLVFKGGTFKVALDFRRVFLPIEQQRCHETLLNGVEYKRTDRKTSRSTLMKITLADRIKPFPGLLMRGAGEKIFANN